MRLFLLIILPFLSIFFQTAILSFYSVKGGFPDVLLIVVVFYALLNNPQKAINYGFLCGLLEDVYTGSMIGCNALAKGATAYVISRLQVRVFKENLLAGVLGVFIGSIINSVIIVLISIIVNKNLAFNLAFFMSVGIQMLGNVILAVPLYLIYYKSYRTGWLMPLKKD